MSDDVLVRVENVSKRFCRSLKRSLWYGLQDLGSEIGGRRHGGGSGLPQSSADVQLRPDEFWAVKDVSFELRRGECLGLIGRNGAGKTTLLRMLNGLIKPDTGRIEIKGSVGALIALGAGFNPLLTGYENIETSLSLSKIPKDEYSSRKKEIIAFSGLGRFLEAPLQTYSSGMNAKLGFACAIASKPDVLIIDEVLAVGDHVFRSKCFDYISSVLDSTCVIFVSHSTPQLARITTSSLMLKDGQVLHSGQTGEVIMKFLNINENQKSASLGKFVHNNIEVCLTPVLRSNQHALTGETLELNLTIMSTSPEECNIYLNFLSVDQQPLAFSSIKNVVLAPNKSYKYSILYRQFLLQPGNFTIALNVLSKCNRKQLAWIQNAAKLCIMGESDYRCPVKLNPVVHLISH